MLIKCSCQMQKQTAQNGRGSNEIEGELRATRKDSDIAVANI